MLRLLAALFVIIPLASYHNALGQEEKVVQEGYSTKTLREPIFSEAEVAVETAKINNWLNANYDKLTAESMTRPREHIYYLINSRIKHLYAKTGKILPREPDLVLKMLFNWAEPLGVFGGGLINDTLNFPQQSEMEKRLTIPGEMSLTLNGDLFKLESKEQGWRVKMPYYFMIGHMADQVMVNQKRAQLIIISTGVAKDSSQSDHSQATLMLIYSPCEELDDFTAFWQGLIGIEEGADTISVRTSEEKSVYTFDADLNLHKEFSAWQESQGVFGVFYSGLDGTYQWNRQHFLDFLNALEIYSPNAD